MKLLKWWTRKENADQRTVEQLMEEARKLGRVYVSFGKDSKKYKVSIECIQGNDWRDLFHPVVDVEKTASSIREALEEALKTVQMYLEIQKAHGTNGVKVNLR